MKLELPKMNRLSSIFHRPALQYEKDHSHLTMIRFTTFHRSENKGTRSHLTIYIKPPNTKQRVTSDERRIMQNKANYG